MSAVAHKPGARPQLIGDIYEAGEPVPDALLTREAHPGRADDAFPGAVTFMQRACVVETEVGVLAFGLDRPEQPVILISGAAHCNFFAVDRDLVLLTAASVINAALPFDRSAT